MLEKYFTPEEIDKLVEVGPRKVREVLASKPGCGCKECQKKDENLFKHLEHDFYKKVDDVTDLVKIEQIVKGSETYDEPFNPDSWTNKQLVWHQLQELRDAQVYGVGLLDRLEKQDAAYKNLLKDYEVIKSLYEREMDHMKDLTEYLMAAFPNCGKAGDHCVFIAIKAINQLKSEAEYWRLKAIVADKRANDLQNTMYETREF